MWQKVERIARFVILMLCLSFGTKIKDVALGMHTCRAPLAKTLDEIVSADIRCQAARENHPKALGIVDAPSINQDIQPNVARVNSDHIASRFRLS
jgi:hypothetical protein